MTTMISGVIDDEHSNTETASNDKKKKPVPGPWSWNDLTQDQARDLWTELTEWVTWLRDAFQLATKIKPCWFRHRAVREHLTALMVAHKAVYMIDPEETQPAYREDLVGWHVQWYPDIIDSVGRLLGDCTSGTCAYRHQTPVDDTGFENFVDDDVRSRKKK
ncbi:hypothetical protein [Nocardia sp. NPDC003963]